MNWEIKNLKPWVNDVVVVVFLVLMAVELYFRQVARLGLSQDGLLLTYFMQTGDLLAIDIAGVKDPGRPFLGIAWHIAALLTGGNVSGYNTFMFSCLMSSAVLVYFLVRTLLPRQPVWALLASTLKIVWSANYEVFDNSGLAIYFAETLFWLAFWLLTILILKYERLSRFELIFASLVMMTCILVVVGTYQTPWPVVMLTPLALIMLGVMRPRIYAYTYRLLVIWYIAALPMMYWCYSMIGKEYLANSAAPIHKVGSRFLIGLWAATGQALLVPFALVKDYSSYGINTLVVVTTVVFAVLLVWAGMQSWSDLRDKSCKQVMQVLTVTAIISLIVITVSLLPPSLRWEPTYGSRFMHWSSIGTILGIVTVLAGLYKMHAWIGGFMSAGIAIILIAWMMQQTYDIGNHYANVGFQNRRFWEDLSIEIPSVDEGTVVLMNGPERNISTSDRFSTQILRFMTETHLSFFITDGKPVYNQLNKTYSITTLVDLNQVEPMLFIYYFDHKLLTYARYAKFFDQPHTFQVPANRVVWVEWDVMSRRLQVIPERSAMERVRRNIPSTFGQKLFPKLSIEHNRVRENVDPFL